MVSTHTPVTKPETIPAHQGEDRLLIYLTFSNGSGRILVQVVSTIRLFPNWKSNPAFYSGVLLFQNYEVEFIWMVSKHATATMLQSRTPIYSVGVFCLCDVFIWISIWCIHILRKLLIQLLLQCVVGSLTG